MIYNKDAAFSYPILSDSNTSYADGGFYFELNGIADQSDAYELSFDYEIDSDFVKQLLDADKAALIFIIQSKDNLFFELNKNQKILSLPKSRIAFDDKVRAQLHLQSKEKISFAACNEFNPFYHSIKDQLTLPKYALIGYSNVSTVRNTGKEGVALFEKTVDPNMSLEFQVVLSNESILLKFKDDRHLLQSAAWNRDVMNIYLYNGLEKALMQFISENLEKGEEALYLENVDDSSLNNLHYKLHQLLMNRGIEEVSIDQSDFLVQEIAPDIIKKFTSSIERLNSNGS